MRWRKSRGFDLPEDEREGPGQDNSMVMRGDELPLVSSPQPRLSSSASSSLSSTQLSTLEDTSTSTTHSNNKMDASITTSLTGLTTSSPVVLPASNSSPTHKSAQTSPTRPEITSTNQIPPRVDPTPNGGSIVRIDGSPRGSTTTITMSSSPPHQSPPVISTSPSTVTVTPVSSQRDSVTSQSIPVNAVKVAVNSNKPPAVNGYKPSSNSSRPTSGTQQRTSGDGSGVVVVVKSDPHTTTTTTVPVTQPGVRTGVMRNGSTGGNREGRRPTHEKSKSVTIVVNDQQHHSHHHHSHSNGTANGDVTVAGLHKKNDTDSSRPSSAASFQTSVKVDPDIQVRPLVGWGGGEATGSVIEDAASSDDCHRSTLTLVHSPARTYLSGDGDGGEGGAAWGSGVVSVCGITTILGATLWFRLPHLLYQYGAGNFLSAWGCVMVLVAIPLTYLEASLAQFSSSAALALWRLVPIARGVGWSSLLVCLYWMVVVLGYVAPLLHYLILALHPQTLQGDGEACPLPPGSYNNTGDWLVDHYSRCVYDLPESWHDKLDLTFSWPLIASTCAATLLAAITGACGPRSIATVTTVTSMFAVLGLSLQLALGLVTIFGRDVEGLWETAKPFLTPQPSTLMKPEVWVAAIGEVLLSLGLATGVLISFSSRASFRFPLRRNLCGLVSLVLLVTVVMAVVVIIQLTLLASDRHLPLSSALQPPGSSGEESVPELLGVIEGSGVISTAHLLSVLPFPTTWLRHTLAVFVYLGLWSSGVTTCVGCVHTVVAALRDTWDCLPRPAASIIATPFILALAIITTTKSGVAILSLVSEEVLSLVLFWPPFTLIIAITTIYGLHKLRKDFTFMLEASVSWMWAPVWGVILPLLLLGVVVWLCVVSGRDVVVLDGPGWRIGIVWVLRAIVILPVPITAMYVVNSQLAYGVVDKVASSLQSSREWGDWGPQDPIEHHNWRRWREDETRPITSLKRRLATRPLTYTHSTLSSESSSTLTRLRSKYQHSNNGGIPSLL